MSNTCVQCGELLNVMLCCDCADKNTPPASDEIEAIRNRHKYHRDELETYSYEVNTKDIEALLRALDEAMAYKGMWEVTYEKMSHWHEQLQAERQARKHAEIAFDQRDSYHSQLVAERQAREELEKQVGIYKSQLIDEFKNNPDSIFDPD